MAHKGKAFPVQQLWRLYSGSAEHLNGYPPQIAMFRTQGFVKAGVFTASNVTHECYPMDWTPGDREIGYQSAPFAVGLDTITVGTIGKVTDGGLLLWKYALWDGGVEQIPWGWRDQQSHWPWSPGSVEIIGSAFPDPMPWQPVGVTELWGKPWP